MHMAVDSSEVHVINGSFHNVKFLPEFKEVTLNRSSATTTPENSDMIG